MNRKTKIQIAGLLIAGIISSAVSFGVLTFLCLGVFRNSGVEMQWRVLFGLAWGLGTGLVTWGWILPVCLHLWIRDRKRRILGEY